MLTRRAFLGGASLSAAVDAILQAKTGQLHPEKVGDWCDRNAFRRLHRRRERGDGLSVVVSNALTDEHQMHRAARPRVRGVHEHIDPCSVPIGKTVRSNGVSNPMKIGTRDGDIDVSSQSSQERVHPLDVQEDTEPATTRYGMPALASASANRRTTSTICSTPRSK
jgi:hypothetical protein